MFSALKRHLSSEYGLVFYLSLALLFGLSYSTMAAFDVHQSVDQKTYWGLAHFDFEQVVVRKYRVIVPFLAAALNWIIVSTAQIIKPTALSGDFSLRFSFFIVNLFFSASFCTLIYAYCRAFKAGILGSLAALALVATSKWTIMNAGTPMVDSLFCCTIMLALLGMKKQNTTLLVLALLLGPFAKESFLFFLPVIFFYSHSPKLKIAGWILLSGVLVFSYRYLFDHFTGHIMSNSLQADLLHFTYIRSILPRFWDVAYLNDFVATIGLWFVLPKFLYWKEKPFRTIVRDQMPAYSILYVAIVFLQMLVSGDLARMLYLVMPIYALSVALSIDYLQQKTAKA